MASTIDIIGKMVRAEVKKLATWLDSADGLGDAQIERLEKLARVARQLELDSDDDETPAPAAPREGDDALAALLKKVDRAPEE